CRRSRSHSTSAGTCCASVARCASSGSTMTRPQPARRRSSRTTSSESGRGARLHPPGRARGNCGMSYDEDLAERIRGLVGAEPDLTEKTMFGGLAFMIGGNMAVAASGQGGMLVRVDPERSDELVATTNAVPMEMRGRSMKGWLRIGSDD